MAYNTRPKHHAFNVHVSRRSHDDLYAYMYMYMYMCVYSVHVHVHVDVGIERLA